MIFTFDLILSLVISISVTLLVLSILADFILYSKENRVKKSQQSVVATCTMFIFYFVYYTIIRFGLGKIYFNDPLGKTLSIIGTIMVVLGAIANIIGRLKLKDNWSDHIKIYDSHELIKTGIYSIVRHPLYSSLMLMLFGGVLVYKNYLSFILTLIIFIPFMYYRARQEEIMLLREFPTYQDYQKSTGMFFPKFRRR